jgi:hypothetical protein
VSAPLLLLDVDGVLNPYGWARVPAGFSPHHLFAGEEPVLVNPEHGRWIDELAGVFEVVWATSWNEEANRLLAPLLGIQPLPAVAMPAAPFPPGAKVAIIDRFAGDRPAVWIDDLHTSEARSWADRRAAHTLLIPTDPAVGLTRAMVDRAVGWAGRLR